MTCYYQNVRSLNNKLIDLQELFASNYFKIIALVETWLDDDLNSAELGIGYTIYRRDRGMKGGGLLIAVGDTALHSRLLYTSECIELLSIIIHWGKSKLCLVLLYLPPPVGVADLYLLEKELESFIHDVDNSYKILILGDFNLPDYDPNLSVQIDKRSKILNDIMSSLDLNQSVLMPSRLSNYLDLIYNNLPIDISFKLSLFDSDHLGISIMINTRHIRCNGSTDQNNSTLLNLKKTDYEHLINILSAINWGMVINDDVNQSFDKFIDIMESAIKDSTPVIPSYYKRSRFPWCDKEINDIFRIKNGLHNIWIESGSFNDYALFKSTRLFCKALFKEKKEKYLLDLENSIEEVGIKPFWNFVKSQSDRSKYGDIMSYGDREVSGYQNIANLFADYFSTQFNTNKYDLPEFMHLNDNFIGLPQITNEEVIMEIKNLNNDNNLTPDGISNCIIVNTAEIIAMPLSQLFNLSINKHIFPDCLKTSWILPKHKTGKTSQIINFRPIAVSPSISKIFEKIVYHNIYRAFKHYFSEDQHGFLHNRSVMSNLVILNTHISRALDMQHQLDVIYTDFAKAFDTVNHNLLVYKLSRLGFSVPFSNWITSFLSGRKQKIYIMGQLSYSYDVSSGVIQGSVLGPLLFLLFVNDIPENLNSKALMFADDLKIFYQIGNQLDCLALQKDLNSLAVWCYSWGLNLNINKCCVVTYCRNQHQFLYDYTIRGNTLTRSKKIRDLGVIYTYDFKFHEHVMLITRNASKSLGFIKRNSYNFKQPKTLITMYYYLVRSKLEFASVVWNNLTNADIHSIEQVQYKFLRFLYCKLGINPFMVSYYTMCKFFNFNLLQDRRLKIDLKFLHCIIHSAIDCSFLLSTIHLSVPGKLGRHYRLFFVPISRNAYFKYNSLIRAQLFCNFWGLSPFEFFHVYRLQFNSIIRNSSLLYT